MEPKVKLYESNIPIVSSLADRLGISLTMAVNEIVRDWELNRLTKKVSEPQGNKSGIKR